VRSIMSGVRQDASSPSRTQRWLDLLVVLLGQRYPVPIDRIMEEVPAYRSRWIEGDETDRLSVRRMFERDKEGLRAIGIPVESERLPPGGMRAGSKVSHGEPEGYRVRAGDFYLPYLRLIPGAGEGGEGGAPGPVSSLHSIGTVDLPEGDMAAGVAALRAALTLPSFPFDREARSALRKLTFDLDPALDPDGGIESRVRLLDRPGGADPAGVLGVLMQALHDQKVVNVRYRSIHGKAARDRRLAPWGLLFQWGSWYLVARDLMSGLDSDSDPPAMRVFRVDRISGARQLHPGIRTPEFEIPDEFDLRKWAGRKPWELDADEGKVEVLVHFLPPASLHAERNGWGELASPDGHRRFLVSRRDPFLRWILSFAGEAHVVGPPEMAGDLDALALRVAAAHEDTGCTGAAEGTA